MNFVKLITLFICFFIETRGFCDVPVHFQFVFGPSPDRAKNLKAKDLFDSQLQIDLAESAARGDTNQLQKLIDRGADVNNQGRKGMKPLFWALIRENLEGFKFLLDHGADPNAAVAIMQPPPENALTLAASMNDSRYLKELLKHGANPNLAVGNPSPQTAIFTASFYRQTNSISILLEYHADIDWKDTSNNTALHRAVYEGSYESALFLYKNGADPLIKNSFGYTTVDTMKKYGDRGQTSSSDKRAFKALLDEFRKNGLLGALQAK